MDVKVAVWNSELASGKISKEEWRRRMAAHLEMEEKLLAQRAKVKKIFDTYDTDKSGAIDAAEFGVLAYELGLTLSPDEVKATIKQLDKDGNGTIDFEEFLAWWRSPKTHAGPPTPLNTLRAKLAAKYAKEKTKQAVRAANLAVSKIDTRNPNDTFRASFKVSVGDMETARSSLKLVVKPNDAATAGEYRTQWEAAAEDVLVLVSFGVREGADTFALGELSGLVGSILSMVKGEAGFSDAKIKNSEKALDLGFVIPRKKEVSEAVDLLDASQLEALEFNIDLSTAPGDAPSDKISVRASLAGFLKRDKDFIMGLLAQGGADITGLSLLASARHLDIDLAFDHLNEAFKGTPLWGALNLSEAGAELSWDILKKYLVGPLAPLMNDDSLPDEFKQGYYNLRELLSGVDSIVLVAANYVVKLEFANFPIFALLPTREELAAAFEPIKAELLASNSDDVAVPPSETVDAEKLQKALEKHTQALRGPKEHKQSVFDERSVVSRLEDDSYWNTVETSDSEFGKVAVLRSIWWLDSSSTFKGLKAGKYQVVVRMKMGTGFKLDPYDLEYKIKISSALEGYRSVTAGFLDNLHDLAANTWFDFVLLSGDTITVNGEEEEVVVEVSNTSGSWKSHLGLDYFALCPVAE